MTNEFILSMSITFLYPDFSCKNFFMEMESTMIKISPKTTLPFWAVKKLLQQSVCGRRQKRKGQEWVGERRQPNYCCILRKLSALRRIKWNQRAQNVAESWREAWIAPSPKQKYFLTIFFYCYHCFSHSWNFIYNISFVFLSLFLFFVYLSLKSTGKKLLINMNNSGASLLLFLYVGGKFSVMLCAELNLIKLQSLTRGGLEACFISQLRWQSGSIDALRRTTHLCYSVNRVQK